ncbi:MAG: type II toxin-antitoxin system VapC family toxin [Vicinamibacterales bacterium]|jgi:PIN domain nuclease of toxin-antitoxin system
MARTRGYLLDTNAALIALTNPARLSRRVRKAVLTGPNHLSVVVYWEVLLKTMKGAVDVGEPRTWWLDALDQLAATPLVLRPEHVSEVSTLPPIHKDPFDRVLIAQSTVEDLTLLTTDGEIPRYASDRFRVMS